MEKISLLLFCCLIVLLSGSPLYPSLQFGQRDTTILMTSSIDTPAEQAQESRSRTERVESRAGRHADAIFTNSYRKVLGQISARKFLQTIMGKRTGFGKQWSDVYEGTYKEDQMSTQRRQTESHTQTSHETPDDLIVILNKCNSSLNKITDSSNVIQNLL
ncbi:somatoliberin [Thalassophryne amazonica]|uniref:somatoliberin n=1 Tax=Thalassophryne amazonica TaxID=390379 RepID=UPI001471EE2D|nr:somatoliberin [Thalassophryne amazonica]